MANNSIENIQPTALDDFIFSLQSQKLVSQVKIIQLMCLLKFLNLQFSHKGGATPTKMPQRRIPQTPSYSLESIGQKNTSLPSPPLLCAPLNYIGPMIIMETQNQRNHVNISIKSSSLCEFIVILSLQGLNIYLTHFPNFYLQTTY